MAGGWSFVTSYDDHLVHDVTMISYLVFSALYHFLYPAVYSQVLRHTYTQREEVAAIVFG
jgi:hypothetical protein